MSIVIFFMIILSYYYFDIPVVEFFYGFKGTMMYEWFKKITDIGKAEYQLIPAFVFYLYFRKKNSYYAKVALIVFLSVAVAGLSTDLIKLILGRYRPIEYFEYGNYGFQFFQIKGRYTSMPSGHTTTVFAAAFSLSMVFKRYSWIFIFFAFFIAFSRIVTLNHYPSDVLGGILVAYLVTCFIFKIFKKKGLIDGI
ncbi:MAG: phosphatase PAP2 family protein [Calditerrivibrio sp.]|nr:phosphatase PAP2 family protein [Calditerrivibrio sp.]